MGNDAGIGTTGLTDASRIITDYKAGLEKFPVASFDWSAYVNKFDSSTGGDIEVTFSHLPADEAPEVAEGAEPAYTHANLSKLTITVKKYAVKPAVTREMIEDSRFDEMRLALDGATQQLTNTYVKRFLTELRAGPFDTDDIPEDFGENTWAAASNHKYKADHNGTLVEQSQAGHVYNTGAATLFLGDIHLAVRHIREHGFNPDTMLINVKLVQDLMDMSDFVSASVAIGPVEELNTLGQVRGTIAGLQVIVSPWVKTDEMIVTSRAAKPVAFGQRRAPTLETYATGVAGADIEVRHLSARFGFKTMWKGATVVATVST